MNFVSSSPAASRWQPIALLLVAGRRGASEGWLTLAPLLGVGLLGIVLFLPRGLVGSLVMMQYIRRVNRPKEKNGMDPLDDVAQVAACTESRGANHVSGI